MEKYILLGLLSISSIIKAQDCNVIFTEDSEATTRKELLKISDKGELIISKKSEPSTVNNYSFSSTGFLLYKDKKTGQELIELKLTAINVFALEEGDHILLKTNKGNIINLEIPKKITSKKEQESDKWELAVTLPLSDVAYNQIDEEKVSRFLLFPHNYYEKIKEKGDDIFQEYLKCVLN